MHPSRVHATTSAGGNAAERLRAIKRGFLVANAVVALVILLILQLSEPMAPWLLGAWVAMLIACLVRYPELRGGGHNVSDA